MSLRSRGPRRGAPSLAVIALCVGLLGAGAGACGNGSPQAGREGKKVGALDAAAVPNDLLGLKVTREDTSAYLNDVTRAYLERFGLYSMREGDVLQATLQVSKFTADAEYDDPSFRARLVNQIGSSKAQTLRMGDTTVEMTTGTKQQIAVWFRDRFMFVLSVRDDYPLPRTLLRKALEIKP